MFEGTSRYSVRHDDVSAGRRQGEEGGKGETGERRGRFRKGLEGHGSELVLYSVGSLVGS